MVFIPSNMIVILHNIRSLYNVGSIFRTSDAAGVEKIYLCGITPKPIDEFGRLRNDFAKVALGAEKTVEWEYQKSANRLIGKLKDGGYKIFAIEQSNKSEPYYRLKLKGKSKNERIALIVGSEVGGLPKSILNKCDKILEIPMKGKLVKQAGHPKRSGKGKESLNVSVAFGIAAFELVTKTLKY